MEPEREEVYERIPWETLEKKGGDRQWMVYAVAGAVTLGALAYSFFRSQPIAPAPGQSVASTVPATTVEPTVGSPPSTVASPIVVAEADLYAVDPERVIDQVSGHAEWFAVEYVSMDGSEESRRVLSSLLPEGVPLPEAPEGTQVFVDWVGTLRVTQTSSTSYEAEVLVRSLGATPEGGFVRQEPRVLAFGVDIGADGLPRVTGAPSVDAVSPLTPAPIALVAPPGDVLAKLDAGEDEVVGGLQRPDGTWDVVVMVDGGDGVRRPVTIRP